MASLGHWEVATHVELLLNRVADDRCGYGLLLWGTVIFRIEHDFFRNQSLDLDVELSRVITLPSFCSVNFVEALNRPILLEEGIRKRLRALGSHLSAELERALPAVVQL